MEERPIEDLPGEVFWRRKPQKRSWRELPESEMKRANRRLGTRVWTLKLMSICEDQAAEPQSGG